MKTPDEIKRGLACAGLHTCPDEKCPYYASCAPCELQVQDDALDLIQQLQDENAQQARCIENMTDKLNAMNDEVAKLQAERDAAVESMRKDPHCCFHCKHKGKWPSCNSDPRPNGSCFEWRGVTKEGET